MSRMPKTIGAVQYLNTKPLVHGLTACGVDVVYDLPSRLSDRLASGELDVALIPSIELFRGRGYRMVSDACIGCRGPVMSVKLFFEYLPGKLGRSHLMRDRGQVPPSPESSCRSVLVLLLSARA